MRSSKARKPGDKTSIAFCGALLVLICLGEILPLAYSQQTDSSQDIDVGLLVSPRLEDARAILQRLKEGADFGVLAKERSIDPSARNGGYLGRVNRGSLQPEFQAALRDLKPGQYTEPVQTSSGYAILTVFSTPPRGPDQHLNRVGSLFLSGAIVSDINLSGQVEANYAVQQYPKSDGWNRDLSEPCSIQKKSRAATINRLEQFLSSPDADAKRSLPLELEQMHGALGQLYASEGDMDRSVHEWEAAYQIAQAKVPDSAPIMQAELAVAYLHKSEMENGIYRNSGNQDLFPPVDPNAHYEKEEDSQAALQYFLAYLKEKPEDLRVKWLLNLTYATLGGYPAKVPAEFLIPPDLFGGKESIGRFTDVAPAAGLNVFSQAGAAIMEDFDNDGLLDLVTSSQDRCEGLHYFHNNGDGTFTDKAEQAGISNQLGALNMVAGDYNNDGCMDLLVLRGGWEFPWRKSLLRNNCNGTFTDVTAKSGLMNVITATQTAVWADIDNDGYLDLFVGNENSPSQLFRNKGDGTFEDISHSAGVDQTAFTKGVAAADYDNDGYVDFYLSNTSGTNFLYHNNHDLTFTEIGQQAGVQAPYISFATWFFDYDNDGWPDIFVTGYLSSVNEVMLSYLGRPYQAETLKLYRNLHNGAFQDVTAEVGLDKVLMPMGANFGDIDNDGFLDIYLGMGQPSYAALMPHTLLRNKEGKDFVDITASSGTGELHKGHGIAFGDLERNGREDIVAQIGGAVFGDKHTARVFQNPGNDNDWINVCLIGVKSTRSAVGAQIKVTVRDAKGAERSIYRTVGDTSSFGGNPLEQHIGLGHGASIVSLETWWPVTNTRQKFVHVDKNQFIAITEFAADYAKLERHAVRLGVERAVTVDVQTPQEHAVTGLVVEVDATHGTLIVSCDAIPNYMAAMEMSFTVREPKALTSVQPGKVIRFTMAERGKKLYAENIKEHTSLTFEPEPMEAGVLTVMHKALDPSAAAKIVPVGKPVPEFVLTDQIQKQIHLSQLQGKVVALTFGYSRCPNPNYCFRLSSNLAMIAQRFQARAAHDLVLLTIMIDPEHDQGAALNEYANNWKADPAVWHFLTGPLPEIRKVAGMFGMDFWNDEGLLTHPLHTIVIDRAGQLVANVEGNQYTAKQLGDLVETVLDSKIRTTESKLSR